MAKKEIKEKKDEAEETEEDVFSEEDEDKVRDRLKSLGYL
jgi:hypothetical protein